MNYITEINRFYDWLETNPISDSPIVLWHALMHINNKTGWKQEFAVAISTLQLKTSMSRSSIIRARNILQQAGRLTFRSRNGQQSAVYSLIAFHGDTQSETQRGTQTGTQRGTQCGTQTDSINKLNNTKLKETKHSFSGEKSPVKKSEESKIEFWEKLVEAWFVFYESSYSIKPSFNAAAGKHLKQILERLEKLTKAKGFEWTEGHSVVCLNHFLAKAKTDNWLNQNFLLSNLNSQFDKIVNPKNDGTTNNKPATGGSVDTGAAFKAIDRMFAKTAG